MTVIADFELGTCNALKDQDEGSDGDGHLFHFKQALREKLIELKISTKKMSISEEHNLVGILRTIPTKRAKVKEAPFFISLIKIKIEQHDAEVIPRNDVEVEKTLANKHRKNR